MNSLEFYKEINNKISRYDKSELLNLINNIIRKIPENKYEEVLKIIDKNSVIVENIDEVIKHFEKKLNK